MNQGYQDRVNNFGAISLACARYTCTSIVVLFKHNAGLESCKLLRAGHSVAYLG